jgi:hypothetical protein
MGNVFDGLEDENGQYRILSKSDMQTRFRKLAPKAFRTLELNLLSGDGKISNEAAKIILDRCGYGPQSKITIDDTTADMSSMSSAELAAMAAQLAQQLLEQDGEPVHKLPFDVH